MDSNDNKRISSMRIKKSWIIYAILLAIFIFAMIPWLKQGVPVTDDYRHHAMRFWFIKEQISHGKYSEWMPYIYNGWPFLHFYHPMFYILSLPIIMLFNAVTALKAATIFAYAVALFGTFYAAKMLFKDREIALVAAAAYFLSSHFLFHATVSGALPRLMATAVVPLALAFFIKALEEDDKKIIIICGILLAALLMTHMSVAVPALIMCFIYALYNLYLNKNIKAIAKPAIIFLIVIGLSAAWIFPLLLEKEYANFPESQPVLDTPIFGQTLRTFGITYEPGKNYIRSNYFGYSVLALALLSLFFIKSNKTINFLKVGLIASIVFYFNIFGILNIIPFIKTALTESTTFFISSLVFNAAMLAGIGAKSISKKFKKDYLIYAIVVIIFIELSPGLNAFSYKWVDQPTENFVNPPQLIEAWNYIKQQEGDFAVLSLLGQDGYIYHNKNEFGYDWEGCPQCVQKKTYILHNEIWKNMTNGIRNDKLLGYLGVKYYVIPCQENQNNKDMFAFSKKGICVYENKEFRPLIESIAEISSIEQEFDRVSFETSSANAENVLIKINYFKPHWHAYVNGKETEIKEAWPEFMLINVPAGENNVLIDYKTNTTHIASWFITLLTISFIIWFIRK